MVCSLHYNCYLHSDLTFINLAHKSRSACVSEILTPRAILLRSSWSTPPRQTLGTGCDELFSAQHKSFVQSQAAAKNFENPSFRRPYRLGVSPSRDDDHPSSVASAILFNLPPPPDNARVTGSDDDVNDGHAERDPEAVTDITAQRPALTNASCLVSGTCTPCRRGTRLMRGTFDRKPLCDTWLCIMLWRCQALDAKPCAIQNRG